MKKIPYILIAVIAVLSIGFILYRKTNRPEVNINNTTDIATINQQQLQQATDALESPQDQNKVKKFTSPDGYSFSYPASFKIGQFEEGDGKMVLLQSGAAGSSSRNLAFQIYSVDFDEEGPLTAERIKKDLPDQTVDQPQTASLDKVPAVAFYGNSDSIGKTYEVWLIRNKKLFQISGYAAEKDLITKILNTWKWR